MSIFIKIILKVHIFYHSEGIKGLSFVLFNYLTDKIE